MDEWEKAKKDLIKDAIIEGRITYINKTLQGICEDCLLWKELTPDHRKKRSQGGSHDKFNIDWVCLNCHDLRDNMGDPKKKKETKEKAGWQKSHKCKKCGVITVLYLCHNCGQPSA